MIACPISAPRRTAAKSVVATPASRTAGLIATLTTAAALLGTSLPAAAVDGCQVLLCLAAPSWRAIPQCVPTITQLLRNLARGRAFPSCAMAGSGNAAGHTWASAPSYCPPQYTRVVDGPNGPRYYCNYTGAVSVTVNGAAFARTWWAMDGNTVTEFSPAAKAQLGRWDTQFDDDYAVWLATQPPPAPPTELSN